MLNSSPKIQNRQRLSRRRQFKCEESPGKHGTRKHTSTRDYETKDKGRLRQDMHTQVTRGDETGVRTVTDTNRENEPKEVKPNTKTQRTIPQQVVTDLANFDSVPYIRVSCQPHDMKCDVLICPC